LIDPATCSVWFALSQRVVPARQNAPAGAGTDATTPPATTAPATPRREARRRHLFMDEACDEVMTA
jgi:hypothetical protein